MLHEKITLYQDRTDVTLTTYVLQHSSEFLGGFRRPAVLVCPGGGYMVCSEAESEPIAVAFNRMGYNAFVLNYSVYSDPMPAPSDPGAPHEPPMFNAPSAILPPKERSVFPNPMLDIRAAMEEIQKNSNRWLTDPDQIALCGFSAGAHNAGIYSVYCHRMNMPRPVAVILGYPLGDIRDNFRPDMSPMEIAENKNFCVAMLGTAEPDDAAMDRTSITKQIDEHTPPMFLWNTSEDALVMPVNSLHIAEALSLHHVPFELHTFECGPHGLSTADELSAIARTQLRPDVAQWLSLADTWLKKRLHVSFPETSPF